MKLQYVFNNPKRGSKMAKKRKKRVLKAKSKRRRNPLVKSVKVKKLTGTMTPVKGKAKKVFTKGKSVAKVAHASKGELAKIRALIAKTKATKAGLQDQKRGASAANKKKISASIKRADNAIKKAQSALKTVAKDKVSKIEELKHLVEAVQAESKRTGTEAKVSVSSKYVPLGGKKVRRKKKTSAKKRATKKKTAKKTSSKKRKTVKKASSKRRVKKTAIRKKKVTRRRSSKKASVSARTYAGKRTTSSKIKANKALRKNTSVSMKTRVGRKKYRTTLTRTNPRRKNPMFASQLTQIKALGPIAGELGALAAGGAFYGTTNKLMATYASPVYNMMQKIPVVGTVLPNIILGALFTYGGQKVKNDMAKQVLMTLGQGLIGAGAVGIGVNASQMIPALSAGLSGVSYIPGPSSRVPGAPGADFSGVDFTPSLRGVDFTPEMSGVDFTPEMGSYAESSSDFGDYEQSSSDFGGIPDGMGLIPEGLG